MHKKIGLYVILVVILIVNTLCGFIYVYYDIYNTQLLDMREGYHHTHELLIRIDIPWIIATTAFLATFLLLVILLVLGPVLIGAVNYIDKRKKMITVLEIVIYLVFIIVFMIFKFIFLTGMYNYFTAIT